MEEAKQEGIKQRHKFLSRIGAGLQKYDMTTTGSEQVDRAVHEEITQFDIDEIRRDEETRKDIRDWDSYSWAISWEARKKRQVD